MTVQSDLQKALASAESLKGSYAVFASSTEDKAAKTMFQEMSQDMQRHVDSLSFRLKYLEKNNPIQQ
ncbi:MAG: DUF1657 domain-containing protein [Eubacteriales bacterium]